MTSARMVAISLLPIGVVWSVAQVAEEPDGDVVAGAAGSEQEGAEIAEGAEIVEGGALGGELFPDGVAEPAWFEHYWRILEILPIPLREYDAEAIAEAVGVGPRLVEEAPFIPPPASSLEAPKVSPFAHALTVPVNGFVFVGNTVFSDEELGGVVSSFLAKKRLTTEELQEARLALTKYYIKGGAAKDGEEAEGDVAVGGDGEDSLLSGYGYLTSGAVLPDQNPWQNGGVVQFNIIEGDLTRIEIEWVKTDADGNSVPAKRSLWDHYIKPRVRRGASDPVHMLTLKEHLELLQRNPNIRRINAELKPDAQPGESYLELKIEPEQMFHFGVDLHNERSPSVGAEQVEFWLEHTSLTRHGDRLALRYGLFERGLEEGAIGGDPEIEFSYTLPVTSIDTMLDIGFENRSYHVIEEPFTVLGIEGRTETWRVGIVQPVFHSDHDDVTLGLHLDRRHTETSIFGMPFSLTPGAIDGEIDLTVLRFSQDWIHRESDYVMALRSILSFGIDAFDPTDNGTERDGEFFAWLGQAQLVKRFVLPRSEYEFQAVLRGNVQLTNSPLLVPEQYSIGGSESVRGYRENQLVRDMGYLGSLELRFPIWTGKRGAQLSIAPFVDVGGGWNKVDDGLDNGHETIASAGAGLLFNIRDRLDASLYWGHGFSDFDAPSGRDDLQDQGVHFRVSWQVW